MNLENESPTFDGAYGFGGRVGLLSPSGGVVGGDGMSASGRSNRQGTPNEISAPYEVPQFPIEEIERKLAIQRQLSLRSVLFFGTFFSVLFSVLFFQLSLM